MSSTNIIKYVKLTLPDGNLLTLNDYGASKFDANNNLFSQPTTEASAVELPRSLEAANSKLTIPFDSEAYPSLQRYLVDYPVAEKTKVEVGYSIDGGIETIFYGYISNYTITNQKIELDIESILNVLSRGKVFKTSQVCRWGRLGDEDCGFSFPYGNDLGFAVIIAPDRYSFNLESASPDNYYTVGTASFQIPDSNGEEFELGILSQLGSKVILFERIPNFVDAGAVVRMKIGCNRTQKRCQELGNFLHFGGSPEGLSWTINNRKILSGTRDKSR